MFGIFDDKDDFLSEKRSFFGRLPIEISDHYDWNKHIDMIDSHPASSTVLKHDKFRIALNSLHCRTSSPEFANGVQKEMEEVFGFDGHPITNIAFTGFGKENQSYPRHADRMDVFLLQVLGEIEMKLENHNDEESFFLRPGEYVWIPRGTHHQIIPHKCRVTFSFGVEGEPDPSLYF